MMLALHDWPPPTPDSDPSPTAADGRGTPRSTRRRARLIGVLLVAGSLVVDRSTLVLLPILFLLVVPFEKLFPRHRGQRLRRPGLGVDVAHALASPLLGIVGLAAAVVVGVCSLAWIPGLMLRPLVATIPGVLLPFVGIALFDMASYWVHRWSHEVPLLWRFHAVHHSTEHLDWVSGFRNHPFDGAIVAPPFFLLLAAGFDATFTGALAVVQVVTGIFLHANVRWRLRPLHRIVITPEFHHWHHTNERAAHRSNYSIFLPVWDTIFGTFFMPTDRRPQVYGIDEAMASTLWGQVRQPFAGAGQGPAVALRSAVRHPWSTVRRARGAIRSLVGEIWRSTTRPTRHCRDVA